MSQEKHYAFLNDKNVVVSVLAYQDEELPDGYSSFEEYYGEAMGMVCKRACPNTIAGENIAGGTPFRGNYPELGYIYDEQLDAFIAKQPYPSWTFDIETYSWYPPVPYPEDSEETFIWNEKNKIWVSVVLKPEE